MGIKTIGRNKHVITLQWTDDGRRRKRRLTVYGSRKSAERYEKDLKSEMRAGRLVAQQDEQDTPSVPTFSEYAEIWFQDHVQDNKPNEVRSKRLNLDNHLLPYFGKLRLDEIPRLMVQRFKREHAGMGYAPSTVNNRLAHLSRLFNCAIDDGYLEFSPASRVKKLKDDAEKWCFLDFDEADQFLLAAPERWRPIFEFAIETGLRKGEILALRWKDVDETNRLINVRHTLYNGQLQTPKSKSSSRAEPMTQRVVEMLTALPRASDFVFPSDAGTPFDSSNLNRPLAIANQNSGLDKRVRFHDLRHTFASHLALAGVPIKAIQDLLGHATMTMTLRYAHLSPEAHRQAILKLENHKQVGRKRDTPSDQTSNLIDISARKLP